MLETVESEDEVIVLCRALSGREPWANILNILDNLIKQEVAPETIRRVIISYFMSVIKNPKSNDTTMFCLSILESFSEPIYDTYAHHKIVLGLASLYFN
jgi:hypothetical protein